MVIEIYYVMGYKEPYKAVFDSITELNKFLFDNRPKVVKINIKN